MFSSIYLIRHAAYDYRPSPTRDDAASDFGLNARGRLQSEMLAKRLLETREIEADELLCSTLPRARQTAEILSPALRLVPTALPDLCEWENGRDAIGDEAFAAQWNQLSSSERRNHRFDVGSETIHEFTARVHGRLRKLTEEHQGESLVLVVHGGVIEAAFAFFLSHGVGPYEGGYPAADYTSITLWRRRGREDDWIQEFANDTHHLRGTA